jgi:iron complex outermembrane receptor protein
MWCSITRPILGAASSTHAGGQLPSQLKIDRVQTSGKLAGREDGFFRAPRAGCVKASAPRLEINLASTTGWPRFGTLVRRCACGVDLIDWDGMPMNYDARVTTDLTLGA